MLCLCSTASVLYLLPRQGDQSKFASNKKQKNKRKWNLLSKTKPQSQRQVSTHHVNFRYAVNALHLHINAHRTLNDKRQQFKLLSYFQTKQNHDITQKATINNNQNKKFRKGENHHQLPSTAQEPGLGTLLRVHIQPRQRDNVSPHEILYGRPYQVPHVPGKIHMKGKSDWQKYLMFLLTTLTEVKVAGKPWIHYSRVKKASAPKTIKKTETDTKQEDVV
ncbi:hypothetical protein Nmel_003377 [Mimus melanotis]